jgi:hypothetical protein
MTRPPDREEFTEAEWKTVQRLNTPAKVQRFFSQMPYNWENHGGTLRSFREVIKLNQAHCLEAAVGAAVILEQHGYPPLLLDIESKDQLDHVVFVFQQDKLWGSIARSRDIGLHGRKPLFRSLRDLVWSYFDPYVDFSGRIKGYGLARCRIEGCTHPIIVIKNCLLDTIVTRSAFQNDRPVTMKTSGSG